MQWLMSGIRDRNLLSAGVPDFKGAELVTACNIDIKTESNRRTSSSLAASTVDDPDIVIALGANVTDLTYRNITDNAFEVCILAVIEWLHKNG